MKHLGDLNIALLNITTNACLKGSYLFLADELDTHFLDLCKTWSICLGHMNASEVKKRASFVLPAIGIELVTLVFWNPYINPSSLDTLPFFFLHNI